MLKLLNIPITAQANFCANAVTYIKLSDYVYIYACVSPSGIA